MCWICSQGRLYRTAGRDRTWNEGCRSLGAQTRVRDQARTLYYKLLSPSPAGVNYGPACPSPPHWLGPPLPYHSPGRYYPRPPPQLQKSVLCVGTPIQALQGSGWLSAVPQSSGSRWMSQPTSHCVLAVSFTQQFPPLGPFSQAISPAGNAPTHHLPGCSHSFHLCRTASLTTLAPAGDSGPWPIACLSRALFSVRLDPQ